MKVWDGNNLKGWWLITTKVDGVQAIYNEDNASPVSRKGKPLYNLPPMTRGSYEVWMGTHKATIQACRTKNTLIHVEASQLYRLSPAVDDRLKLGDIDNPAAATIRLFLDAALAEGHEGIVLHPMFDNVEPLKVIPFEDHDVVITGLREGAGRHKGRLGALLTTMGKVGTGFTDADRLLMYDTEIIGETVQVRCKHLTPAGRFRHARFVRMRWDK